MRRIMLLLATLVAISMSAQQTMEERFRAFQQKADQDFANFRAEANQQYADFLRGAWQKFTPQPVMTQPKEEELPPVVYVEPEPVVDPVKPEPVVQDNEIPVEVVPIPDPAPEPEPIAPVEENTDPTRRIEVEYQGTMFSFRVPMKQIRLSRVDGDAISKQWLVMSGSEYDNMLFDCMQAKEKRHLCDWAYIELTGALSEKIYGASNEARLLQAFILAQSGYAMRLAEANNKYLYVLVGSNYQLYDCSYYTIDGLNFYALTPMPEDIHICPGSYGKEKPFSLQIQPEQELSLNSKEAPVRQSDQGIVVTPVVNTNAIQFYNSYPTGQLEGDCGTRWATYANAPMEECVRRSLYPTLMKAIEGLNEQQAVNKLLNWVQTAFEYQLDDVVWGQDRAFFPSETLNYPYADCEDRAILFSRVVRDLTKLDVALVYYPGHLAAAVAFKQEVGGDYIQVRGKRYVVCDPTYIGAPVGRTMPGMNNMTAKVIELR